MCYIRVNSAFVTAYNCKSYKCGGMEVFLAVYMFLLICSKLIWILWGCVCEVQVNLHLTTVLLPSLSHLCQKTPCTKAGVCQLQADSSVVNCKL